GPGPAQRSTDERPIFHAACCRYPGVSAGVNENLVPVQDFVWRIAQQAFAAPVSMEFNHCVRGSHTASDSVLADTIRVLKKGGVPWAN
ncbi:MAG: hypothetical protein ABI120_14915, partial [Gemmatimonadaceae bacterium]